MATTELGTNTDMVWQGVYNFDSTVLETIDNSLSLPQIVNINDVSDTHQPNLSYGCHRTGAGNTFGSWSTFVKLRDTVLRDAVSLGQAHTAGFYLGVAKELADIPGVLSHRAFRKILKEPVGKTINWSAISGKYIDGVTEWDNYPYDTTTTSTINMVRLSDMEQDLYFPISELPESYACYWSGWHGSGNYFYLDLDDFLDYGFYIYMNGVYVGAGWSIPGVGETAKLVPTIDKVKIYYLNPVVNSFDSMVWNTGDDFVMNGKGFQIPNDSLDLYGAPVLAWEDDIEQVEFIGLQGQGTYTVLRVNMTVDNDTVTILTADMPALPDGTYEIKITKHNDIFGSAVKYYCMAGDYRCYDSGELYEGKRFILCVGACADSEDEYPDDPIIYTKWKWKSPTGEIDAWYAPIDVRCTDIFYDGRLLSLSPITRGISGSTGLYVSTEVTAILANTDMDISTKLAEYTLRNQVVQFWHGWQSEPEGWKEDLFKGYVYDYALDGDRFIVKLKDVFTKWFEKSIPEYTITLEDYPNAKENAVNQLMPEVLGYASYTTGEAPGAVEALCVDTTTYKYLASRGSLKAVMEVYADGDEVNSANYEVTYEDGGRTYITFDSDQEEKKITFNAKGYMHSDMNSVNGYIQNPAYIILFVLGFIIGVPYEDIDIQSVADLATLAEDMSAEETGFFVLQYEKSAEQALAELLFTIGSYGYFQRSGKFAVLRKDISNFATEIMVFSQIDTIDNPRRSYNFTKFVNRIKGWWNKVATANIFQNSKIKKHQSSIDFFEAIVDNSKFELPWTTGEGVVNNRINEELYRKAYGPWSVEFSLPINWLGKLDLLDNFRLQDPYGVSLTGAGEAGRYCFVDLTTIDAFGGSINIVAMDLAWILSQYCILGDETGIASNWNAVTFEQRMYCYLCDEITNEFADGMPGKILIDENII